MPRYFFDITDGVTTIDDTGQDYPDVYAARDAAIQTLSELARDEIGRDKRVEVAILIREKGDRELFRATLTLSTEWATKPAE